MKRADQAQLAMALEVCAYPKPGNVDRCHDYEGTTLEHFLASTILARPALERAEAGEAGLGELIHEAVAMTSIHQGGNTHFGAFILLIPLVAGGDIPGANARVNATSTKDAVAFYEAFSLTRVRTNPSDPLDVSDPRSILQIRESRMTLLDVMAHSAENDMVAAEWVNGFFLTGMCTDLLIQHGCGRRAIVATFLDLLAFCPDTFITKEHGPSVAVEVQMKAKSVVEGTTTIESLDEECIARGINPGSSADIIIAAIYLALGEGWQWDC
ncbi:MAG: triphosphoribosyl-dephospho-CoA synthase [Methanomicrobiales archaeon]|nr:triphosphoribosyl-dephospho-CoA synthase [Methanomicrobiales archaeon]